MTKTNTLSLYCDFAGWKGGTIHQAKEDFTEQPTEKQDQFCNQLMDGFDSITDFENVNWFFSARNQQRFN